MKCINCKNELRDGAKFCTNCGSRVKTCSKCNVIVSDNAKYCTKCGNSLHPKVEVDMQQSQSVAMSQNRVRESRPDSSFFDTATFAMDKNNRIYWKVLHGEIARRVDVGELKVYGNAKSIVINQGTTAYIKSECGAMIEVESGVYDFVSDREIDNLLDTKVGGFVNYIKRGFQQLVVNNIIGNKVRNRIKHKNDYELEDVNSIDELIRSIRRDEKLSLTLKLNKDFDIIFGDAHAKDDDYANFEPMLIKTKYTNINIGVHLKLYISDFSAFANQYLSDKSSVTISHIAQLLSQPIKRAIQEVMNDEELEGTTLPLRNVEDIKAKIIAIIKSITHGVDVREVVSVSTLESDMDRFREISRELYLSEREMDYMLRTDDMNNRFNSYVNSQEILEKINQAEHELKSKGVENEYQAKLTEQQIEYVDTIKSLQTISEVNILKEVLNKSQQIHDINKDQLLDSAEFELFKLKLSKSYNEKYNALKVESAKDESKNRLSLSEIEREERLENRLRDHMDQTKIDELDLYRNLKNLDSSDTLYDAQFKSNMHRTQSDLELEMGHIKRDTILSEMQQVERLRKFNDEGMILKAEHVNNILKILNEGELSSHMADNEEHNFDRHSSLDIKKREAQLKHSQYDIEQDHLELERVRNARLEKEQLIYDEKRVGDNYESDKTAKQDAYTQKLEDDKIDKAFNNRVKNDDYEFEKRRRERDSDYKYNLDEDERQYINRKRKDDLDFESKERESKLDRDELEHSMSMLERMDESDRNNKTHAHNLEFDSKDQTHKHNIENQQLENSQKDKDRNARIQEKEMELDAKRMEHDSKVDMELAKGKSAAMMANLSSDQILAIGARDNTDPAVALEYAKSLSANKGNEMQIEMQKEIDRLKEETFTRSEVHHKEQLSMKDRMIDEIKGAYSANSQGINNGNSMSEKDEKIEMLNRARILDRDREIERLNRLCDSKDVHNDRTMDRFERVQGRSLNTAENIAGVNSERYEDNLSERDVRFKHQEERYESNQDRIFDYATKGDAMSEQSDVKGELKFYVDITGEEDIARPLSRIILLIQKGVIDRNTYVRYVTSNMWVECYKIEELSMLFSTKIAPKTKKCANCNTTNDANDKFCCSCGEKI